jgi:hypothetical protein
MTTRACSASRITLPSRSPQAAIPVRAFLEGMTGWNVTFTILGLALASWGACGALRHLAAFLDIYVQAALCRVSLLSVGVRSAGSFGTYTAFGAAQLSALSPGLQAACFALYRRARDARGWKPGPAASG